MSSNRMERGFVAALAVLALAATSASWAQIAPRERPPWLRVWVAPQVPAGYRSPAEPHKVMVPAEDRAQISLLSRLDSLAAFQYQGRTLHLLSTATLEQLSPRELEGLSVADELNLIRLRDRFIDTTVAPPEVPLGLRLEPGARPQLHLVQFVGPVQDEWLASLQQIGGVQIVSYFPENAYLLWAGQSARGEVTSWAQLQPYVQWQGPFHPAYKVHPRFDPDFDGNVQATVQLVGHEGVGQSVAAIRELATSVLKEPHRVGVYTNLIVEVPAAELESIARLEDVVNVEPFTPDTVFGERQGQILAGSLNAAGTGPAAPGYLAWLNGLGFNTNFGFVVDVTDDGFDRGLTAAASVHPTLLDAGGNSRVAYVRRVNGTTISTTNDNNTEGHGTINVSIVGGLNNTAAGAAGFAYHGDAAGYRYGLGIAPFVLVGSTDRFAPGAAPDFTTIIDAAYTSNARISNNSWGATFATGAYDATSQEYDGLVRDARPTGAGAAPSGGAPGNQEMVIVFAAGNSGPGANTLGDRGATAKNTITVGAGENFNATGAVDGCIASGCCGDADANDIRQVIGFSSRGPTDDARVGPDITAPGTHVFGAASQDPGFTGSTVCGGPGNDGVAPPTDAYYPPDPDATDAQPQDLYTWSSGTSHAAPAVAGAAALLRQRFLDQGHPAPSPAMTKAYLMNSATYMTGPADNLYSNTQGMGRTDLSRAFDNTPRLLFDQVKTAHTTAALDAAEIFTVAGQVADVTRPFRVTMAYTDSPGAPGAGVITNNNLNLEVQVGGSFYRGNNFTQGQSNAGAVADPPDNLNNVESVFLPAGTAGNFTVTVRPTNINSDGVPNNGDATDQDFSLVIYNGQFPGRNPVDIILVLDVSGSMNSTAAGGTVPKIELLRDAVEMFIRSWEPFSIPADRMGVVYFSSAIAATFPAAPTILLPFQANANNLIQNVRAQATGGCTALGAGILAADGGFDALPDRQRHIVVFTNGMQNRSPMVTSVGAAYQILADPAASCGDSGVAGNPGVNIADYTAKKIHAIGTGVSGAAWTALVTGIASQTGGLSHFTSTPDENLEDFFLDTLVAALRVDPVEKIATVTGILTNADSGKSESFEINSTTRKATFAVSWRGDRRPNALAYTLVAPDGTTVPSRLIQVGSGPFYRISSLDFPLGALPTTGAVIPHAGTWRLVFEPELAVSQVSYRVHLIVDDADVRYHFDAPTAGSAAGDAIPLTLWVQHGNRTLTGLDDVRATISRPPVGFGTFLATHPVSADVLNRPIDQGGDQFANLAGKKAEILLRDAGLREQLTPRTDGIQLFDDGLPEHGDAKADDGVYSALYTETLRPGFYDVGLSFRLTDPQIGTVVRSESKTLSVGIGAFDLDRSTIDVTPVADADVAAYDVKVILIDRHGNYLGPGNAVSVVVAPPGAKWGSARRRVALDDNLDGSYSARVNFTTAEVESGAGLRVEAGGLSVAQVPVQPAGAVQHRFGLSFHGGINDPRGSFASVLDGDWSWGLDLEYRFDDTWAAELFYGLDAFDGALPAADLDVEHLSLNGRAYLGAAPSRWLLIAGLGRYDLDPGPTETGFNLGVGWHYSWRPRLAFEATAKWHSVATKGPDFEFLTLQGGIRFSF